MAKSGSGAKRFPIDGHGWRDHSWGPRYWQAIYWYRLFLANFPNGDGLMLLKITDEAGKSRRVGVLLVDGQYEDIVDMDLATEWTEQKDPRRVEIGVRTANRKAIIAGEIMTLAPLRNRRKADGQTLEVAHRRRLYPLHLERPAGLRHDRIHRAHRERSARRLSFVRICLLLQSLSSVRHPEARAQRARSDPGLARHPRVASLHLK